MIPYLTNDENSKHQTATSITQESRIPMGTTTKKRIIEITFVPQAWINDYAVDVDTEGPDTWDVTTYVTAMSRKKALALRDNRENSDPMVRFNAPRWVRNWRGPYRFEVENSIAEYFGIDNNNHERNDDDDESST